MQKDSLSAAPARLMSPLSFLVLLILSTSIVLCTAQPVLKIGWVRPLCGEALAYYFDQEEALLFWANYTNENGGVNVNGTAHQVQMVLYVADENHNIYKFIHLNVLLLFISGTTMQTMSN